jgi:hypothetical protein
VRTPTWS